MNNNNECQAELKEELDKENIHEIQELEKARRAKLPVIDLDDLEQQEALQNDMLENEATGN